MFPELFRYLLVSNRNKFSISYASCDLSGGLGPDEGLGVLVRVGEEANDGAFQLDHAGEIAAPNSLLADDVESAFDQIQPGCAGRGEVQVKARMAFKPGFYPGVLVSPVIVADQV